ncbi:MAG: phospho-sugar mutase [Planctomycetia bacterium]|nr:phospho-sugar mutase [Planctomycetia bacterium]
MPPPSAADVARLLDSIAAARAAGTITEHSAATMRDWLTQPRYAEFTAELASRIDRGLWKELDDVYWTVIPFGTGGRRGMMYPVGSNAINDRTIGESAQGLADHVRSTLPAGETPTCAIAYDTRHRSEHFAKLCTEVLLAAGFKVYFLRGVRSTPELSFAVRFTKSTCGIMVTASHNPPTDNAVKVYWEGGVQVLPPHDRGIIDRVMKVDTIHRESFESGVASGRVQFVEQEIDPAFVKAVLLQSAAGPRDISILYTPLHGVGATAVVPVLTGAGFERLRLYGPHETPDGDFPNVPGHVANPENPAVLGGPIEEAKARGDDLVLASDPDCDRLGAAAPLTRQPGAGWSTFTGNQLCGLLCEQAIAGRRARGESTPGDYVVTTIVTSGLVRRVAESHGLKVDDTQLVGFKWICSAIDGHGPAGFVFGTEESHGYLAGTHVRDKDAAVAALLMAEQTAALKAEGRTPHEKLDELFTQHGCHQERQINVMLPGATGMERMQEIMAALRATPPKSFGGLDVARTRDQASLRTWTPSSTPAAYAGVPSDVVLFDLAGPGAGVLLPDGRFPPLGNAVAARPSGTEPKIKFYLFAYAPPGSAAALPATKQLLHERLDAIEKDLRAIVGV